MEIRINSVSKDFFSEGKKIKALSNVDLTIPANQIFTLLGPSGCGKTTLLRCVVGLETPDSGEITIGEEIVWSKEKNIFVPPEKRGLSMVFQTYAIWPHMTVFDNVAYPLQTRKEAKDEIRAKVDKTLRFVQLEGFENRPATKLSGGQQQRVALARALVPEPKVILFDEPLSNLDAKLREETRKELRSFLNELKITAVYVTHDRIEALSLSDTIAVMMDGRLVEIGTPKKIYFDSDHRFVADFIGQANLINGKVVAIEDSYTIVDSSIGTIACQKGPDTLVGNGVTLCIRPEFIKVIEGDGSGGSNIFRGRVESLLFVGDAYEGEIIVADTRLIVRIEPTAIVEEGDEIALSFDPDHCFVLSK
ncbi:MAG: ABC transporter [Nitrospira bacterium SG8_3]|jgi:iron(III) transport system ATP-binding protein|nr:MAG: ABC transporter [Nitrospira bacterium SG8_3]